MWSPDGKWLYVSAEEADSVDIVDVAKGEVVKSVKVGDRPRGIGFLPDGSRAYVAAENADMVNVFDTAKQEVIARIKVASRSNGVVVHPDGKRVFLSSGGKGTVQVLDTATNAIVAETPVGKRPWNMALTPDGKKLYVACGRSNAVAVIDTDELREDRRRFPSANCRGASRSVEWRPARRAARGGCCGFSAAGADGARGGHQRPTIPVPLGTVEVVGTTPLPGLGTPLSRCPPTCRPSGRATSRGSDRRASPIFSTSMRTACRVNSPTGNTFQPDVSFRGFTASSLLGTPQGLSVFQDGVRINEAFADVVNWDLLPKNAVASMQLLPGSNPSSA